MILYMMIKINTTERNIILVITIFISIFVFTSLLEVIKKQNLKQIPLPIYPVNTDNEIMNYHSYLSKYIEYNIEFNSNHPYNRNNGTMIPNRGYQHIFSLGFFAKIGPLNINIKPEHHYAENKIFDGFWEDHRDVIWERRYLLWNRIDLPLTYYHCLKVYLFQFLLLR